MLDALHVFDKRGRLLLTSGAPDPVSAKSLSSVISREPGIIELSPSQLVYVEKRSSLIILVPCASTTPPLVAQEFTKNFINAVEVYYDEPFSGSVLENHRVTVMLILSQMLDAGLPGVTEPDIIKDRIPQESFFQRLLSPSITEPASGAKAPLSSFSSSAITAQAYPWRRTDVRHSKEEIYVDIVEYVSLTSGRPYASVHGEIHVLSELSGVPDVTLSLAPQLPSPARIHRCVDPKSWKESQFSKLVFVPPDGPFLLASYSYDRVENGGPLTVELRRNTGPNGTEFEVYLSTAIDTAINSLENLVVTVVSPPGTRLLRELRTTAGDFDTVGGTWNLGQSTPTGWNATLSAHAENMSGYPVQPLFVRVSYAFEGRVPSRTRVRGLDVRSTSRETAFKGVKLQTRTQNYVVR